MMARIGQKNGLVRQWARRGTRPRQPVDQRYDNAYLFGAICPARGVGAALALPYADTDMMQLHRMRRMAKAYRPARTDHIHRNAKMGPYRSALITVGMTDGKADAFAALVKAAKGRGSNMGQFSVEKPVVPGSILSGNQQRHGTTTLFAALSVLEGKVIGRCVARHRHQEFIRFIATVERSVPAGKVIHAILDNYAAHKHPQVLAWLAEHPRWTFHFHQQEPQALRLDRDCKNHPGQAHAEPSV